MSQGYVDPITKKFVKAAGNMSVQNTPCADESTNGLMSYEDKQKLEKSYTTDDVASTETINSLFTKGGN